MEKKKTEICPIYDGKGYSMWRQCLKLLLAKEGLKSPLHMSEDERKNMSLSENEREVEMSEYNDKQDKGRCLIMERLDDGHTRRIDPSFIVRQILERLDEENATTSKVGLMVKRQSAKPVPDYRIFFLHFTIALENAHNSRLIDSTFCARVFAQDPQQFKGRGRKTYVHLTTQTFLIQAEVLLHEMELLSPHKLNHRYNTVAE